MTPGRGEEDNTPANVTTKSSLKEEAVKVIDALGGGDNIEDVDACITRLRVSVKDISKVSKDKLKANLLISLFSIVPSICLSSNSLV